MKLYVCWFTAPKVGPRPHPCGQAHDALKAAGYDFEVVYARGWGILPDFLNEIVWAYDFGGRSKSLWPAKHDTILVYVKDPRRYYFDSAAVDREPYMAPGLVGPEKAARGKLPTDVWWHTIVSPTGREKTGYPTQKPEGILRRIVQASTREGDWVLDFFAGSGTTGAVAATLGRRFVLVDENPEAIAVMRARFANIEGVEFA